MRILAIDYGDARVGFAVSDISEFLASGIGTVKVTGMRDAVAQSVNKIKEYDAKTVVIGLPVNMNGTETDRSERYRMFGNFIKENIDVEIIYYDERMTTIIASGYMNTTGTFNKKRKALIDTLSAEIILQNYLDRKRNTK